MNLPKYFKPIENCYIKIHHLRFKDFNILIKTHVRNRFCTSHVIFFNLTFNEHYHRNKKF